MDDTIEKIRATTPDQLAAYLVAAIERLGALGNEGAEAFQRQQVAFAGTEPYETGFNAINV